MEDAAHTNSEVTRLCGLIRRIEIQHTVAATVQARNLSRILTHHERGCNVVPDNQVEALGVLTECFISRSVDWQEHVNLIPLAIEVLQFTVDYSIDFADNDDDDDHHHHEMTLACLRFFREMATIHPRFFDSNLHEVLAALVDIFKNENVGPVIRIEVARVLNIIAISRNEISLKRLLFNFSLRLLRDMVHVHQWQIDREQYAGWSMNTAVGNAVMGIIAESLNDDIARKYVERIPEYLAHENWRQRYATILTFSKINERCYELMENVMDDVVPMIVSAFVDTHSRVRYMAVKSVGAIYGSVVPGSWKERCLPIVIFPVIYALKDAENPMIQEAATETASKLIPTCNPQLLSPYLAALLEQLRPLLVGGPVSRRLHACRALADLAPAAALSSQSIFATYHSLMTPARQVLIDAGERPKADAARNIINDYLRNQVNLQQQVAEGCTNIWKRDLKRRRLQAAAGPGPQLEPQPDPQP